MYIIKNYKGEVFVRRSKILKRPIYAPPNAVESAAKFRTKEDAEAYIAEKLIYAHIVAKK